MRRTGTRNTRTITTRKADRVRRRFTALAPHGVEPYADTPRLAGEDKRPLSSQTLTDIMNAGVLTPTTRNARYQLEGAAHRWARQRAYARHRDLADEYTQSAALRLYQRAHRYRPGRRSLKTWAHQQAHDAYGAVDIAELRQTNPGEYATYQDRKANPAPTVDPDPIPVVRRIIPATALSKIRDKRITVWDAIAADTTASVVFITPRPATRKRAAPVRTPEAWLPPIVRGSVTGAEGRGSATRWDGPGQLYEPTKYELSSGTTGTDWMPTRRVYQAGDPEANYQKHRGDYYDSAGSGRIRLRRPRPVADPTDRWIDDIVFERAVLQLSARDAEIVTLGLAGHSWVKIGRHVGLTDSYTRQVCINAAEQIRIFTQSDNGFGDSCGE